MSIFQGVYGFRWLHCLHFFYVYMGNAYELVRGTYYQTAGTELQAQKPLAGISSRHKAPSRDVKG